MLKRYRIKNTGKRAMFSVDAGKKLEPGHEVDVARVSPDERAKYEAASGGNGEWEITDLKLAEALEKPEPKHPKKSATEPPKPTPDEVAVSNPGVVTEPPQSGWESSTPPTDESSPSDDRSSKRRR